MEYWVFTGMIVVGGYILLSVLIYYFQDFFLFRPEKLPPDFVFNYKHLDFEEYHLNTAEGAVINGLRFRVDQPKGIVFYLKGNSKSIKGWGKFAKDFVNQGYEVLMVDYRGFGKSTGRRTQRAILEDLDVIYKEMQLHVKQKHIILYGRSLGSGFAAQLASKYNPRMLILEAPYYSMRRTARQYVPLLPVSLLIKFPIPTYKWLREVRCPIHIIHGTNDSLIPHATSVQLAKVNARRTTLHTILGGGHKNLNTFASYHRILNLILTEAFTIPSSTPEHSGEGSTSDGSEQ